MFTQEFLAERREEFREYMSSVSYDYTITDTGEKGTLEAVIQSKEVSGNFITLTLLISNTLMTAHTIDALHVYDENGVEIGERDVSISVNATQTVMVVWRVSYQEV